MLIAYEYYYKTFKREIKTHTTPEFAFLFVQQYGLGACGEIDELQYAWATAIELYELTRNSEITLYERCMAERGMRKIWKTFLCQFQYQEPKLPTVPPLPE
jgi:hypothetical protein